MKSKGPKLGDRKRMKCKSTGTIVTMEYIGEDFQSSNGHPGWICLHKE